MTRKEQRKKVLSKEREIRALLNSGLTAAQVGEKLGVKKQRIYDFLQEARNRKPIADRISTIRGMLQEDRELAKNKTILVYPRHPKSPVDVFPELRELLSRSVFSSGSISNVSADSTLIVVTKIGMKPKPNPAVEEIMKKLRFGVLSALRTSLIRLRQFDRSKQVIGQTWSFTFCKI